MPLPVESSWDAFYHHVVKPVGYSPERIEDMRTLYFCGALALYEIIRELMVTNPGVNSAEIMGQIHEELGMFMRAKSRDRLDS